MTGPKKRKTQLPACQPIRDGDAASHPPGVFVSCHQVPPECREPYQLGGYRYPNYSASQCLRSLLQLHNETFNCWTHIPASVYFLYKALVVVNDVIKGRLTAPEYLTLLLWPLGCCILFTGSSIAHTFNCVSVKCRKRVFLVDYSAISFAASGTSLAYCTFLPEAVMTFGSKNAYILTCGVLCWLGIVGCSLALVNFAGTAISPPLKVFSFGLITVGGNIPMLNYTIYRGELPKGDGNIHSEITMLFALYLFCMVAGGVINGSCCPERCRPGAFDILGHSHQVFHVLVFIAFAVQYEMILLVRRFENATPDGHDRVRALVMALVAWPVYCITTVGFAYRCKEDRKAIYCNGTS